MELKREIRKWDLVLLLINSIIGAGIFGLPSKTFALAGVYSIPATILCGLVVFILVLSFAEVASRFRKTGGPYLYTLEAFGPIPAFIVGWILLITRVATYAALIHLLVTYLSFFIPPLETAGFRSLAIILITLVLMGINYRGIKESTLFSNTLAIAKVIPLFAFILIGLFFIEPKSIQFNQSLPELSDLSAAVFILIFAFSGFEAVLVNTGEFKEPRKIIPFALIVAISFVAIFYALIQTVSIGTLPDLATSEKPITDASQLFMGSSGSILITIGAIISITGCMHVVMLVGSRLPFAMSEEQQLPKLFGYVHPNFTTPVFSLLIFSLVSIAVSLSGSFIYAVSISVISKVMIFLAVCLSLIQLRRIDKKKIDYFKLPFGNAIAIFGVLACIYLLSNSKWNEFRDVLVTILVGIVIFAGYKLWKK